MLLIGHAIPFGEIREGSLHINHEGEVKELALPHEAVQLATFF